MTPHEVPHSPERFQDQLPLECANEPVQDQDNDNAIDFNAAQDALADRRDNPGAKALEKALEDQERQYLRDQQIEKLVDSGRFPYTEAEKITDGVSPIKKISAKSSRHLKPVGHSLNEGRDSEYDNAWRKGEHNKWPSEEEVRKRRAGVELCRQALGEKRSEKLFE